jgi:hypothetical protein
MIKQLLGKAFGVKSEKEISSDKISGKIKDNLNRFSQFVMQKKDFALKEFFTIKEKSKNLIETNYKLGISHLEKGNLSDARMRFFLMTKFWPKFHDSHYQLAYILSLQQEHLKAKKVIEDLIAKNNEIDPKFHELLNKINANIEFTKIDE